MSGNTEKTESKERKETCDYRGTVTWNSLIKKPGALADQTPTHSPMVTGFSQQTEYNAHAFKHTKRLSQEDTETVTSQANNRFLCTPSPKAQERCRKGIISPVPDLQAKEGQVKGIGSTSFEPIKTDEHILLCKEN